jgi:hypothetical protein
MVVGLGGGEKCSQAVLSLHGDGGEEENCVREEEGSKERKKEEREKHL